jgi:hypothetical protein
MDGMRPEAGALVHAFLMLRWYDARRRDMSLQAPSLKTLALVTLPAWFRNPRESRPLA